MNINFLFLIENSCYFTGNAEFFKKKLLSVIYFYYLSPDEPQSSPFLTTPYGFSLLNLLMSPKPVKSFLYTKYHSHRRDHGGSKP